MPNPGYYTWSLDGNLARGARPTTPTLCTRNLFLSNGATRPWKSTAPRNCWIKSVPVLSLPKGRHPPRFPSHRAGLRRLDQTLHLLPRRAPPGGVALLSRGNTGLAGGCLCVPRSHRGLHCTPTGDHTSKISSSTGVRTSYPSSVTTTVFSTPTAPSPGKTTLGSSEKTIPTSRE